MQNTKIDFNSDHYLHLPSYIKDKFKRIVNFRSEVNLPPINSTANKSTIALLVINNRHFWGVNKATAGISEETLQAVREILKDEKGISAHSSVLSHAEADAILDAFNHNMNAYCADMFVDRRLCGFCGGIEFNGGSLRRLLPLLSLQTLNIFTLDKAGKIAKVILTPISTFHDKAFSIR